MMREFDDNIPARAFDNFQFVNFTEIMLKNLNRSREEAEFALSALMEIPSQYKATLELNILGAQKGKAIDRIALPPPHYGMASRGASKPSQSNSFQPSAPSLDRHAAAVGMSQPTSAALDVHLCPICITNPRDMAFGCGHQTCCECGQDLHLCPICLSTIQTREDCFYDLPYNIGYQIFLLRLRKTRDEIMKGTLSIYVDIYFD